MRRTLGVLVAAAAIAIGLMAGTASADVHGVSQAGCAADPSRSGANQVPDHAISDEAGEPGRPEAPIPVSASPFETAAEHPGKGGNGDAACDVPPGPPNI
jgi:hypothetical protein